MPNEETKIQYVNYTKLHLDREHNPRLHAKLVGAEDSVILDYMVTSSNALELMASIGEKGFFHGEPLLVIPFEKTKDEYIVVEGNRRLSSVMLLHDPSLATVKKASLKQVVEKAKYKPEEIPVVIYNSRDEILSYLGYRHITGIKEWDSLAKARYLRELYGKSAETDVSLKCLELARTIGSRSDYVKKLLCALSVYDTIAKEDYFRIPDLDEAISFSLITTALGYVNLREFLGLESGEEIEPHKLNIPHLAEFTKWLFETKDNKTAVGESRDLKLLASVVSDEASIKEFREGRSLETAFLLSKGALRMVVDAIWSASEKLELAFKYSKEDITLGTSELRQLDNISKTALAIKKVTSPDRND